MRAGDRLLTGVTAVPDLVQKAVFVGANHSATNTEMLYLET